MPEANLFLMFTQRLNTLGVAYMVSGSVAVIIYGEPRLTHDVDLIVVPGCPRYFRRQNSIVHRQR